MHIYSIYKATCKITGKSYIGFDSNWPKRQTNHLFNAFNIKSRSYHFYFHNALRKYGWDTFEWEILYQSLDGNHCLNEMEPYFINEYDSFNNGYNMTLGGNGTLGSPRPKSDIWKQNHSKTMTTNNPMQGKQHTRETKEKNRQSQLGKKLSDATKLKIAISVKRTKAKKILYHTKWIWF